MNAPFVQPKADEYQEQINLALLWEARLTEQFKLLEMLIGNCLQLFLALKKAGVRVKCGLQIKAAFEELKRLTGPKAAFSKVGNLSASLTAIETYLEWRAHLTHGVLDVWRGKKGQWLITFHYRETNNPGRIQWHAIPFDDAEVLLEQFANEMKKFRQRCEALERHYKVEENLAGEAGV